MLSARQIASQGFASSWTPRLAGVQGLSPVIALSPPTSGGAPRQSTNAWRQQRAYLEQENLKIALSISIGIALDLM